MATGGQRYFFNRLIRKRFLPHRAVTVRERFFRAINRLATGTSTRIRKTGLGTARLRRCACATDVSEVSSAGASSPLEDTAHRAVAHRHNGNRTTKN